MDGALPRLTTAQAAARLGVKPQTLYAYVARGQLGRERGGDGSTFDALEVEAFAAARRTRAVRATGSAASAGTSQGTPLMVLDTDITLIDDGELFFRGVPAARLAMEHPFEQVARWLWSGSGPRGDEGRGAESDADRVPDPLAIDAVDASPFAFDQDAVTSAAAAVACLPRGSTHLDRIQTAVPVLGAADATRHDLAPDAVRAAAGRLVGGVIAVLVRSQAAEASQNAAKPVAEEHFVTSGRPAPAAAALWGALGDARGDARGGQRGDVDAAGVRALGAALVLLIDHDLAASTLAARAAASARATPYAVVSSGLGALDSALHGNASGQASELIRLVLDGTDARAAVAQVVARTGRAAPGFGQSLYPGIDARAGILLPLLAQLPQGAAVQDAVQRLSAEVLSRTGRFPNVDLALAALTTAAGMPADAGVAIFAVARMAGWLAHALDEYGRRPLRLRPRGNYAGLTPGFASPS